MFKQPPPLHLNLRRSLTKNFGGIRGLGSEQENRGYDQVGTQGMTSHEEEDADFEVVSVGS